MTIHRQLTLCVPQFAGDPLGSRGLRLKPTQPIDKSGPGYNTLTRELSTFDNVR